MPKQKVYRADDEVYILKSQAVALPDKRAMLVLYMTKARRDKTGNGFKKTIMRAGPMDSWIRLFEELGNVNPAELLRLGMLGYNEDYLVYMSKMHITRVAFKDTLEKRFKKALFLKDFLDKQETEVKLGYRDRFAMEFSDGTKISDYENIRSDTWYDSTRLTFEVGRPRMKPRVIM